MLTSHEFMVAKQKRQNQNDKRQTEKFNQDHQFQDNHGQYDNEVSYHSQRQQYGNTDSDHGNQQKQNPPQQRRTRHYSQHSGNRNKTQQGHQQERSGSGGHQKPKHTEVYDAGYVPKVDESTVYEGTVQNYYREKGYGFIRCEEFEVPAFFHYSEIQLDGFKYLIKQQKVEFKARVSDDGKLQAYKVVPLELAPTQKRQIFNNDKSDKTAPKE